MEVIREKTATQSCFKTWQNLEGKSEIGGPRERKQLQNAKYNEKKKRDNEIENGGYKANFADQVQILTNMVKTDSSFVRCVKINSNKVPVCILYSDEQIQDVKRFCCQWPLADSAVFGFDKTFNLADCHLTIGNISYQEISNQ